MIGLDTNVLVRYVTQDDPGQAQQAERIIDGAAEDEEPLYITAVVFCELVWVLEDVYEHARNEIGETLERILRTTQFQIEHKAEAWRALHDFRGGRGDFSDHLIGRIGARAGCRETVSFDRSLRSSPVFRVLPKK